MRYNLDKDSIFNKISAIRKKSKEVDRRMKTMESRNGTRKTNAKTSITSASNRMETITLQRRPIGSFFTSGITSKPDWQIVMDGLVSADQTKQDRSTIKPKTNYYPLTASHQKMRTKRHFGTVTLMWASQLDKYLNYKALRHIKDENINEVN